MVKRGALRTLALGLTLGAAALLPAGASGQAAPELNDASIAHVAVTANAIDVELGELALERATDARVRAFAQTMIRDHRGVNEQAVALAGRLGVTPEDNEVSRSLRADADATLTRLRAVPAPEFDGAYMAREVAYHEAVLGAVDGALIPNTTNGELRALLQQARAAIAAHLEHATQLRDALAD